MRLQKCYTPNGHSLVFLPAYSPFLNPVENLLSKWKGIVKQANCSTEEKLKNEIRNVAARITADDCDS